MALSNSIAKTLVMKPEVSKIFDDLEAWLDHCRMELLPFNPADLYKSPEYKEWVKARYKSEKKSYKTTKTVKPKETK